MSTTAIGEDNAAPVMPNAPGSAPRVLVLQLDASDPPARLGEWLRVAGARTEVRALDAGDALPDSLQGYDGLVVLGGAMGAGDDADFPFLVDVRALLRAAVEREVPVLGVCLGAQLLAYAQGGRIDRMPDGPELGAQLVAKRSAAAQDPLFGALPIAPDVLQWHYDEIVTLPPGATLLASSPVSANQAFRVGRLAWGIQFHIETSPEIVTQWAREDAANLSDYDLDALLARAIAVHEDLAETWAPFAASFAAVAADPSSVAPAAGVPTSTAEPVTDPAAIRAALAAEAGESRAALGMPAMPPRPHET